MPSRVKEPRRKLTITDINGDEWEVHFTRSNDATRVTFARPGQGRAEAGDALFYNGAEVYAAPPLAFVVHDNVSTLTSTTWRSVRAASRSALDAEAEEVKKTVLQRSYNAWNQAGTLSWHDDPLPALSQAVARALADNINAFTDHYVGGGARANRYVAQQTKLGTRRVKVGELKLAINPLYAARYIDDMARVERVDIYVYPDSGTDTIELAPSATRVGDRLVVHDTREPFFVSANTLTGRYATNQYDSKEVLGNGNEQLVLVRPLGVTPFETYETGNLNTKIVGLYAQTTALTDLLHHIWRAQQAGWQLDAQGVVPQRGAVPNFPFEIELQFVDWSNPNRVEGSAPENILRRQMARVESDGKDRKGVPRVRITAVPRLLSEFSSIQRGKIVANVYTATLLQLQQGELVDERDGYRVGKMRRIAPNDRDKILVALDARFERGLKGIEGIEGVDDVTCMELWHGSPASGMDLTKKSKLFLTSDESVARRYATGDVLATGRVVATAPTLYRVKVCPKSVFDARRPEHLAQFQAVFSAAKKAGDRSLEHLYKPGTDGTRGSTGQLVFSYSHALAKLLGSKYDAFLLDESSQGWSLFVPNPTAVGLTVLREVPMAANLGDLGRIERTKTGTIIHIDNVMVRRPNGTVEGLERFSDACHTAGSRQVFSMIPVYITQAEEHLSLLAQTAPRQSRNFLDDDLPTQSDEAQFWQSAIDGLMRVKKELETELAAGHKDIDLDTPVCFSADRMVERHEGTHAYLALEYPPPASQGPEFGMEMLIRNTTMYKAIERFLLNAGPASRDFWQAFGNELQPQSSRPEEVLTAMVAMVDAVRWEQDDPETAKAQQKRIAWGFATYLKPNMGIVDERQLELSMLAAAQELATTYPDEASLLHEVTTLVQRVRYDRDSQLPSGANPAAAPKRYEMTQVRKAVPKHMLDGLGATPGQLIKKDMNAWVIRFATYGESYLRPEILGEVDHKGSLRQLRIFRETHDTFQLALPQTYDNGENFAEVVLWSGPTAEVKVAISHWLKLDEYKMASLNQWLVQAADTSFNFERAGLLEQLEPKSRGLNMLFFRDPEFMVNETGYGDEIRKRANKGEPMMVRADSYSNDDNLMDSQEWLLLGNKLYRMDHKQWRAFHTAWWSFLDAHPDFVKLILAMDWKNPLMLVALDEIMSGLALPLPEHAQDFKGLR